MSEVETQLSLGEVTELMVQIRSKKREAQKVVDGYDVEYKALEKQLIDMLEQTELDKVSSTSGTASLSISNVPDVTDIKSLYEYILSTGYVHLLGQRVSAPAWRELMEKGSDVPGTKTYIRKTINLRTR